MTSQDPYPDRFFRLTQVVGKTGIIPVSRASWYAGVRSGRYPRPIKIGKLNVWRAADIYALVARINSGALDYSSTSSATTAAKG